MPDDNMVADEPGKWAPGNMVGDRGGPAYPLADLIEVLGDQIREAETRAMKDGKPDVFTVKEATVEVAITGHIDGTGKLSIAVLELGGTLSKENANTISVTLAPLHPEVVAVR